MRVLVLVLSVVMVIGMASAAPALDAKVEVIALEVGKAVDEVEQIELILMLHREGTSLTILIRQTEKFLIGLDAEATKIKSMTDDKGTDLLRKMGEPGFKAISLSRTTDDGKACVFEVAGNTAPAKGAKEIRLKADFVLKCGAGEETVEQKDVAIAKGTKISAGPVPMTIDEVGKDELGNGALGIRIASKGGLGRIRKIAFIGPDGEEVEQRLVGTSDDGTTKSMIYSLKERIDKATVRITYFGKVESITVPADLAVGVGL